MTDAITPAISTYKLTFPISCDTDHTHPMSMNNGDLFSDQDVPDEGQCAEQQGKGTFHVDRGEGEIIHLRTEAFSPQTKTIP